MPALRKWQIAWYEKQPRRQVCRDCGKEGDRAYVQPQIPRTKSDSRRYSLCADCITSINARIDGERKEQLAGLARCEVGPCQWRGRWEVFAADRKVLLCGRHKTAVRARHSRGVAASGGLALFMSCPLPSADVVLQWAAA